jgi:hemoglobin
LSEEIPPKDRLKKLFEDIGSEEALEKILLRFYEKMSADTLLGFFFAGHDISHIVKMQKAFLLRAMGIASSYEGKPPARAHKALPPILEGHFDRRLILLREVLTDAHLTDESIESWIGFENQFRSVVIQRN